VDNLRLIEQTVVVLDGCQTRLRAQHLGHRHKLVFDSPAMLAITAVPTVRR
jgi:hypothetical protein